MKLAEHSTKILVFLINSLLFAGAVLIVKDKNENNFSFQKDRSVENIPVSAEILNSQNNIATNRENKLRDLNTSPKSLVQQQIITTTTTVVPDTATKTS